MQRDAKIKNSIFISQIELQSQESLLMEISVDHQVKKFSVLLYIVILSILKVPELRNKHKIYV